MLFKPLFWKVLFTSLVPLILLYNIPTIHIIVYNFLPSHLVSLLNKLTARS